MTSNLFPDIIHSTKDLEFAQLFVDHFSSMSDEDLQIYESLMIKLYQRLIQKYNADNTNFLAANLDEDSQITDVPLNNQHIESFLNKDINLQIINFGHKQYSIRLFLGSISNRIKTQ